MPSPSPLPGWSRVLALVLWAGAAGAASPCPAVPQSTLTRNDAGTTLLTVEAAAANGTSFQAPVLVVDAPFTAACTDDGLLVADGAPDGGTLRLRYVASRRRLMLADDVEGRAKGLAAQGDRPRLERLGALLGGVRLMEQPEVAEPDLAPTRLRDLVSELLRGTGAPVVAAPEVILRSNFVGPNPSIGTIPLTVQGAAFDDASTSPAFWSGTRFCVVQGDDGRAGAARCLEPSTRKWGRAVPLGTLPRTPVSARRAQFCEGPFSASAGLAQAQEARVGEMLTRLTSGDRSCVGPSEHERLLPSPDGRYVVVVHQGSPAVPPFREGLGGFAEVPHSLTLAKVDSVTAMGRVQPCATVTGGVLQLAQVATDGRAFERFEAFDDRFAFDAPPGSFTVECTREAMEFRPGAGGLAYAPLSFRWRKGALELGTDLPGELARAGNDRAALERLRASLSCVRPATAPRLREALGRVEARLGELPR